MKYKYHYTYRITNITKVALRIYYYGVRSTNLNPEKDLGIKYFSSSTNKEFIKDQKQNPHNYQYKIIRIFKTRKEATGLEIKLHQKFDVGVNDVFYNRAKQTSIGFDTTGVPINKGHKFTEVHKVNLKKSKLNISAESRKRMSESAKRKPKYSDEYKRKMSVKLKGRKFTEEHLHNLSISGKGRVYEKITCPFCNLIGAGGNMKRYHFDNCKLNN